MYNRNLIGKNIQEAIAYMDKLGYKYQITRDIYSNHSDELVVRVRIIDGVYHLVTSAFKLHIKDVDNDE